MKVPEATKALIPAFGTESTGDQDIRTLDTPSYQHQIVDTLMTIFVHVPRTGGFSIESTLARYTPKRPFGGHTTSFEYQFICPEAWSAYFKFGFVRNPWDRLVSAFNYAKVKHADLSFVKEYMLPYGDDFSAFVTEVMKQHPSCIYRLAHLRPQVYFLCDRDGSIAVDYVGRFETLNYDWRILCSLLGIELELPHLNRSISRHEHYREYYSPEAVDVVSIIYEADIKKWDYVF